MRTTSSRTALALLALFGLGQALWAVNPVPTRITVPDIHCMSCAKQIAAKLYAVPGVAQVQAKVEAKMLTVVPNPQQLPSPRGLWEAVEKAGYRPSKLEGPYGTFTKKPQS